MCGVESAVNASTLYQSSSPARELFIFDSLVDYSARLVYTPTCGRAALWEENIIGV